MNAMFVIGSFSINQLDCVFGLNKSKLHIYKNYIFKGIFLVR